ncbi:MAG: hypothetical protein ABIE25_09575 [Thermoplasmatota archaeon]|nr:hypothetical protein [Candidatus Thermoplasmatota archaeon]MBU1914219.1 hypothetical protein [Candidatus Thermoplasmatota archaeon]
MTSKEKTSKKDSTLMGDDIDAIFERHAKEGSNLTPALRNFLKDVARRDLLWYRYGCHAVPDDVRLSSVLDDSRRNAKMKVLREIRNSLSDLALLAHSTAPRAEDVERLLPTGDRFRLKPWISRVDVLEVLDLEDLCTVVGYAIDLFGPEYVDAVLRTIEIYHRQQGLEIGVRSSSEEIKQD